MTYNPQYDSVKGTVKPQWANQALATDGDMPMQFLTLTERRFPYADQKLNQPGRRNLKNLDPYQGPADVRELTTDVIKYLLRPRDWEAPPRGELFFLDVPDVMKILNHVEALFQKEPTLLSLKAPMKVFGDIHGQFTDLLRHFDRYGMPTVSGDLALTDYLFLGDYVDRGSHSLEVVLLLFCLKLQRPRNIYLIRGNHEVATMNNTYGFRMECMERFGSYDGNAVWKRINEVFNWLPLGATIDRKVLCMHGGIGPNVTDLKQIESIQRPLRAYFHDEDPWMPTVNQILWSDPAESDSIEGYQESERGPRLLKFGADRVNDFCTANGVELIIRSHQCVLDGFERFAGGRLVTVFSATNYCGVSRNNGAIIQLGRKLEVIVRTIQPKADDENLWDAITNEQNPPSPMHSPRRLVAEEEEEDDSDDDAMDEDDEDDDEGEDSDSESDSDEEMVDHPPFANHNVLGAGQTARPFAPGPVPRVPPSAKAPLPPLTVGGAAGSLGGALATDKTPSPRSKQTGRFQVDDPTVIRADGTGSSSPDLLNSVNGRKKLPPVQSSSPPPY